MGVLDAENANRPDRSTSNNSSSTSNRSNSGGGGLNSAGNRASGAGPSSERNTNTSSTSNRSSTSSSERAERSNTSSVGSDRREIDRSLNDRTSSASTTSDRSTGFAAERGLDRSLTNRTPSTGLSPSLGGHATERGIDRSLGSRTTPATPTGGLYTSARAGENKSMNDLATYRSTDLASRARAAENKSMADLARERVLGTIKNAEAGTIDPYNRLVGGGPIDYADLTSMTVRDAIKYAGTLKANGHLSNVLGAFQFKNTTLSNAATKLGVLDEKFTPEMQDKLAQELLQDRANRATVNGQIDVDTFAEELAKEWASLATKNGSSYYDKNGIDKASVNYATVRDMAKSLVDYGVVSPNRQSRPTGGDLPSTVAQVPTSRPTAERFADTYLGGSQPAGGLSPKQIAEYRDYGNTRGYAPVDPVSRVAAAPQQRASSRPAQSSAAPATRQAEVPAPTQAPRELSTGQQIVAGGIDVLGGMVPGLGTGLTIANAGLKLTGNKTIGERIVSDFANGGGKNGSVLMAREGSDRPEKGLSGSRGASKVTPQTTARFEETYIAPFDDGVKRPTPAERWGGIGLA